MALLRVQTTRHNPRVLEIRTEHQRLYEAIAQRNIAAATQEIRSHLSASKARVVQELENLQQQAKTNTKEI
jgi:DNA-binding FadR family transcriptional regulator